MVVGSFARRPELNDQLLEAVNARHERMREKEVTSLKKQCVRNPSVLLSHGLIRFPTSPRNCVCVCERERYRERMRLAFAAAADYTRKSTHSFHITTNINQFCNERRRTDASSGGSSRRPLSCAFICVHMQQQNNKRDRDPITKNNH